MFNLDLRSYFYFCYVPVEDFPDHFTHWEVWVKLPELSEVTMADVEGDFLEWVGDFTGHLHSPSSSVSPAGTRFP